MFKYLLVIVFSVVVFGISVDTVFEASGKQTITIGTSTSFFDYWILTSGTGWVGTDVEDDSSFKVTWNKDSLKIKITTIDDNIAEDIEYFYVFYGNDTTQVFIIDNDIMSDTITVSEGMSITFTP